MTHKLSGARIDHFFIVQIDCRLAIYDSGERLIRENQGTTHVLIISTLTNSNILWCRLTICTGDGPDAIAHPRRFHVSTNAYYQGVTLSELIGAEMMDDRIYLFAVLDPGQAVQKVVSAPWVYYS